jgi:hypothetical protein
LVAVDGESAECGLGGAFGFVAVECPGASVPPEDFVPV